MKITGYRTLTTVQDWGRPVGDANGVFPDGVMTVPLVLVDTDEGITGVGLGSHTELEQHLRRHRGRGSAGDVALYDRMLRQVFKAGHAGAVFGDHRRPGLGAVGHQGEGRGAAAVAAARRAGPDASRRTPRASTSH